MGSSYSTLATTDDNDLIISSIDNKGLRAPNGAFRNKPIIRPPVHLDAINWLTPVRSGVVISCSSDRTMALNNMDTGVCVMRWRGHKREVTKTIYKHIGCKHFVLSASKDASIRLWYFNSPNSCRQYNSHKLAVTALASLDDLKFVSGSRDGTLNVWDLNLEERPIISISSNHNITHIEYEPQTQMICQTSESGSLRLWDSRTLEMISELPAKTHALLHCDICSTTLNCLTSSAGSYSDGSEISLWDLRERKLIKDCRGHESNVRCSIFLQQQEPQPIYNRLLLSVSNDQTARLWNANTGDCLWRESIPAELNSCVAFPDGSIAIGGSNATLCDIRILQRAGRPFLYCNSFQSNSLGQNS